MEKLSTIQKRDNLNTVFRNGEPGPGGAFHEYQVVQYLSLIHISEPTRLA